MAILRRRAPFWTLIFCLGITHSNLAVAKNDAPITRQLVCSTSLANQIFVSSGAAIPSKDEGALRIIQFNVERLNFARGQHDFTDSPHQDLDSISGKPNWKVQWIMEIMSEHSPDFAVWEEVGSLEAMERAQEKFGFKGYTPYLIPGSESGSSNIGIWVKDNGALEFRYETHEDIRWYDPSKQKEAYIFPSNLPALVVSKKGTSKPALILLGNHSKSQRDKERDPHSNIWRSAQYQAIDDLALIYREVYGAEVPILVAGDFNANLQSAPEAKILDRVFDSAFNLARETNPAADRITQSCFPYRDRPIWSQLDDIKVLRGSQVQIIRARIVRYRTRSRKIIPIPKSGDDREDQPSDHFPILVDLHL